MKLLDKIALNRLIKIITSFILSIIQIIEKHQTIDNPKPDVRKPKFPWVRKKLDQVFSEDKKQ
jgi:hypothetical protein